MSVPPLIDDNITSLTDCVVDPVEAVGGQRRAGRADRPKLRQIELLTGPQTGLAAGHVVRRAGTEPRDAGVGGELPQGVERSAPPGRRRT